MSLYFPQLEKYYGLVGGLAYLLPLSICSIFSGVYTDKVDRVKFLTIGSIIWSSLTLTQSYTDSFPIFVGERILFGVFSAILNPAAYSLIRDYFPEN